MLTFPPRTKVVTAVSALDVRELRSFSGVRVLWIYLTAFLFNLLIVFTFFEIKVNSKRQYSKQCSDMLLCLYN